MSPARKAPPSQARPRKAREPKSWLGPTIAGDCYRIPLDRILPDPDQPRTEFDDEGIETLAGSLKSVGQIQPIAVRRDDSLEGAFYLVSGERRWRAAHRAGLTELTAVVVEGADLETVRLRQLAENGAREDLSPLDEARALRAVKARTGMSLRALAEATGIHFLRIHRRQELLKLPPEVQAMVAPDGLAESTALCLLKLPDDFDRIDVARLAVAEGWTRSAVVREVEFRLARSAGPDETPLLLHGETPEGSPGPGETPLPDESPKPGAPATEDGSVSGDDAAGAKTGPLVGRMDAVPALMDAAPAGVPGTRLREPVPVIYDRPLFLVAVKEPSRLHVTRDVVRPGEWAGTVYVSLSSTRPDRVEWPPETIPEVLEMVLAEARLSWPGDRQLGED